MYTLLLCVHVTVAISGMGQLGAVALEARQARGTLPLTAAGVRVKGWSWAACALVVLISILMEVKPV